MIRITSTLAMATLLSTPVLAESHLSDAAAMGEAAFKKCQTCHAVIDDEGNTLAGKKAKTGPNLYGIVGRTAGTVEGFRYGKSIVAAGEAGLIWDEEQFVAYLQDPKEFLRAYLDDPKAKSKMSFKAKADKTNDLTAEQVAMNYYLFLMEIGPELAMEEPTEEGDEESTEEAASDG